MAAVQTGALAPGPDHQQQQQQFPFLYYHSQRFSICRFNQVYLDIN
jgi:hypothetical protein